MMSSMRRSAYLVPLLLITGASSSAQAVAQPVVRIATASIDASISDWRRLRQSSGYSFADYARFLISNPGWPEETKLRRWAEKAMRPGENASTVLGFFAAVPPTTGGGHARYADALASSGRPNEALVEARKAWASEDLSASDEQLVYARFGQSFTRADHDSRVDSLLFGKKASDAQRMLAMVSPARSAAFTARVAMQLRWPDAEARYQPLIGTVTTDAGLMMDRARYLRDSGYESSARDLFARNRSLTYRPADPERFMDMQLLLAQGAYSDRQYQTAYNIARQLDDLFPTGTDLTTQSYGVRDNYTSLAWLGGIIAFDRLSKPQSATAMFDRYSRGGKSLQVTSKGLYWAGRAAAAAGKFADSSLYFQRAASFPELFYGQLALERLGRRVQAPGATPLTPTAQQRAVFASGRLAQATRRMASYGSASEAALFVRALAECLTSDTDRALAVDFAQSIGRQDLAVWVARAARNDGSAFYVRQAYPTIGHAMADPRHSALTHGIIRQESSFDRSAISHAGARGMMQLMPGTAREQAGKMGYGYDYSRLTSDPSYNVMLGSAYFARLLNRWDGNVPLAVASYNAGAGNVAKWVNRYGDPRGSTDVIRWIEAIPFSETKGYVQRVIENSVVYDSLSPARGQQSALHVSRYLGKSRPG